MIENRNMAEETLENKTGLRETFMTQMLQEIRASVDPILNVAGTSRSFEENPQLVHQAFRKIKNQGEYLLALVDDILDMSAIASGSMELHESPFHLNTVISMLLEEYYDKCKKNGISFTVDVGEVMYENLYGDAVRLKQILFNLLSNAYKYTGENGRVHVVLKEQPVRDNRVELVVVVRDTGCGIAEEKIGQIWESYANGFALEKKGNGSGLGLMITRHLVELMGGSIKVQSTLGEGTVFTVRIPFELPDTEKRAVGNQKKRFDMMRALVVDDDEILMEYQFSMFHRLGITPERADSGDAALKLLREAYESGNGFDIIFINYQMQCDGMQAVKKIRREFDSDTVMIAATAYDAPVLEQEMREAGADFVLTRPVYQSAIYNLMTKICKGEKPTEDSCYSSWDFHGKRVLLAEDNAINAEIVFGYLRQMNLIWDWAKNGREAADMFIEKPEGYYGAVLMDISMPMMNGYEASEEIRKAELETGRKITVPIIAGSANVNTGEIIKVHESGMNAYLQKPIDIQSLYYMLDKYVD